MDGRDWIALLPFWLLVAPPVLLVLVTLMDGTMRRDRGLDRERDGDYVPDRRPVV